MIRMRPLTVAMVAVLASACHVAADPPQPSSTTGIKTPDAPKPDPRVERGQYLSAMLGCQFCHAGMGPKAPDFTRPFSGGFEMTAKFGTWRAPNITQHELRGIGAWTDNQIAAAIREGVRPDGTRLYPIMPYLNFNRMTDHDVNALVAFLRTVPASDNVVEPNMDLALPQPVAPKPMNSPDVAGDPVKHGEYLVTVMHCGMCHTPSGKDGMPDMTKQFAGGVEIELPMFGTGKLVGSNITSDPTTGIGNWSQAEIERSVRTPGVGWARIQLYLTGGNQMHDADLAAIGAYMKTIPAIENAVPKSSFKVAWSMEFSARARPTQTTARR